MCVELKEEQLFPSAWGFIHVLSFMYTSYHYLHYPVLSPAIYVTVHMHDLKQSSNI